MPSSSFATSTPSVRFVFSRPVASCLAALVLVAVLAIIGCTPEMRARAYASDGRKDWQQADRVIAALGLEAAGDELVARHDFIEKQHFLIFEPGTR